MVVVGGTLVRSQKELDNVLDRAFDWSPNQTVKVEQFVGGREFSIESISYQGKHHILQITDKVTTEAPYFVKMAQHELWLIGNQRYSKEDTGEILSFLN